MKKTTHLISLPLIVPCVKKVTSPDNVCWITATAATEVMLFQLFVRFACLFHGVTLLNLPEILLAI